MLHSQGIGRGIGIYRAMSAWLGWKSQNPMAWAMGFGSII